jgi:two-component system, HptB-dependent secretion and biofilm response regulator
MWSTECHLAAEDLRRADPIEEMMTLVAAQAALRVQRDLVGLIIAELYSNALEHGILGLSSDLKRADNGFMLYYEERQRRLQALTQASLSIKLALRREQNDVLLSIRIEDSGKGFDVANLLSGGHEDAFGRGIKLLRETCVRVEYSNGGRCVEVDYPVTQAVSYSI